jgi:hypothetical protein
MPGLDLCSHVELGRAYHLRRPAGRLAVAGPRRIVHAGMRRMRHQLVIGRMKLDLVAAIAFGIEDAQFRRVLIGHAAALGHHCRAPVPAELRQLGLGRRATIGGDRIDQRPVGRIEIDIPKRRRLVEDLVGRKCCLAHG